MDIRLSVMLPEIVIISFSSLGGFLTKFEKMRCEKKNPKQTKQILKSYRTQAEVFGRSYIQIIQDYIYCPRHEVTMGFFNSFIPNVWFSSRVPMVDLIGLYEDETGTFPIATWFPTLRCKTEVSRAMEPLGQNRSRTSLQDRDPACKRNLWDALRCKT